MSSEAEDFFNNDQRDFYPDTVSAYYGSSKILSTKFVPSSSFTKAHLSMKQEQLESSSSPDDSEADFSGKQSANFMSQNHEKSSEADSLTFTYYSKSNTISSIPSLSGSSSSHYQGEPSELDENITYTYYSKKPSEAHLILRPPRSSYSHSRQNEFEPSAVVDVEDIEVDYAPRDSDDYHMYEDGTSYENPSVSHERDKEETQFEEAEPESLTITYYSKKGNQQQSKSLSSRQPSKSHEVETANDDINDATYIYSHQKGSRQNNQYLLDTTNLTNVKHYEESYDTEYNEDNHNNNKLTLYDDDTSVNYYGTSEKKSQRKTMTRFSDKINDFIPDKSDFIENELNGDIVNGVDDNDTYYDDDYEYDDDAYIEEKMEEKDFDSPLPVNQRNGVKRLQSFNRVDVMPARTETMPVGGKNQDYIALARLYKIERPYQDPGYKAVCVLCHSNLCADVFFPCQHRCVCRKCIKTENICDERAMLSNPKGYCNCSLCAGIIKLILPNEGGEEVEKYWKWVYEEPVELPPQFLKDFRHSAGVIKAVYMEEDGKEHKKKEGDCIVS